MPCRASDAANTCTEGLPGMRFAAGPASSAEAKLDGDSRGGAALSVRRVTGARAIVFAGASESSDGWRCSTLQRHAGRILGMGRHRGLVESRVMAGVVLSPRRRNWLPRSRGKRRILTWKTSGQLQQMKQMGGLSSPHGQTTSQPSRPRPVIWIWRRPSATFAARRHHSQHDTVERHKPELIKATRKRAALPPVRAQVQRLIACL